MLLASKLFIYQSFEFWRSTDYSTSYVGQRGWQNKMKAGSKLCNWWEKTWLRAWELCTRHIKAALLPICTPSISPSEWSQSGSHVVWKINLLITHSRWSMPCNTARKLCLASKMTIIIISDSWSCYKIRKQGLRLSGSGSMLAWLTWCPVQGFIALWQPKQKIRGLVRTELRTCGLPTPSFRARSLSSGWCSPLFQ